MKRNKINNLNNDQIQGVADGNVRIIQGERDITSIETNVHLVFSINCAGNSFKGTDQLFIDIFFTLEKQAVGAMFWCSEVLVKVLALSTFYLGHWHLKTVLFQLIGGIITLFIHISSRIGYATSSTGLQFTMNIQGILTCIHLPFNPFLKSTFLYIYKFTVNI